MLLNADALMTPHRMVQDMAGEAGEAGEGTPPSSWILASSSQSADPGVASPSTESTQSKKHLFDFPSEGFSQHKRRLLTEVGGAATSFRHSAPCLQFSPDERLGRGPAMRGGVLIRSLPDGVKGATSTPNIFNFGRASVQQDRTEQVTITGPKQSARATQRNPGRLYGVSTEVVDGERGARLVSVHILEGIQEEGSMGNHSEVVGKVDRPSEETTITKCGDRLYSEWTGQWGRLIFTNPFSILTPISTYRSSQTASTARYPA